MSTSALSTANAEQLALALLNGMGDVDRALNRLRAMLPGLIPWAAPPADVGILLSALAAVRPDAITEDIGLLLASSIRQADLSRTAQPAIDEAFQLLELLIASQAHTVLPQLIDDVLLTPNLHPRWFQKTLKLLQTLVDWRPGLLPATSLISTAERMPTPYAGALFHAVIGPLLLADPERCTLDLLQRACALPAEPSEARYVVNALAEQTVTPAEVRDWASSVRSGWFPLRPVWRRLRGERGLRLLCVQNIADGQGDEMVRLVPLLQALLADHSATRITLVTDRAYLYDHPRLELISFDEPERIAAALAEEFDGVIGFTEQNTPHLNHDTDLAKTLAAYRAHIAPRFEVRAGKGWNRFTFDSVRIDGFEWTDALQLNRSLQESVYDPAFRLIAELGLPLALGTQPRPEPVLARDPVLERPTSERPIALLNPFGGNAELKGFIRQKLDDLMPLLRELIDDGFFVIVCPTGTPWGSRALIDELLERLSSGLRDFIGVAPDPATAPSPRAAMRAIISLVALADLVVTIEGWMMHAAYFNGKPYRLLLMPASGERDWQPWGRSHEQRIRFFQGDPALDWPPCPERPRRAAWLELLKRINDPLWCDALQAIAASPDRDIRRAALRALGRLGKRELRPKFVALLNDRSNTVRALAAEVLLERYPDTADRSPDRQTLAGYRAFALVPHGGWSVVTALGSRALPAIRAALRDDDPVVRRDAATVLEQFSRAQARADQPDDGGGGVVYAP